MTEATLGVVTILIGVITILSGMLLVGRVGGAQPAPHGAQADAGNSTAQSPAATQPGTASAAPSTASSTRPPVQQPTATTPPAHRPTPTPVPAACVPTTWNGSFAKASGTLTSPELIGCGNDVVSVRWSRYCDGSVVVSIVPDAPAGPPSTTTVTSCGTGVVTNLPTPGSSHGGVRFHVKVTWRSAQGTVAVG